MEQRIGHAVAVALDIDKTSSGLLTRVGMTAQGTPQFRETPAIEFVMTAASPVPCLLRLGAVDRYSDLAEMFLDVESIDDLNRSRKQFLSDVPDPRCTVTKHHSSLGGGEAASRGLATNALGEGGG